MSNNPVQFPCGKVTLSLKDFQSKGGDLGSVVESIPDAEQIAQMGRDLLNIVARS